MIVTIELETVREPDYAVGQTKTDGARKNKKDGSRERDEIDLEEEDEGMKTGDRKARDLEEAEGGFGDGVVLSSPIAAAMADGQPATGDTLALGRTGSTGEVVVERTEGRSRQRRSWDVAAALRRRQRELMRMEEEDAFKTQL